jgi:dTDP-4-dehydrorhamnose reductase
VKIGVTGASGMLGSAIIKVLSGAHEIFATSRSKGLSLYNVKWDCFDLTDSNHLTRWLVDTDVDLVIHCAAMIDVDKCEDSVIRATKINSESTRALSAHLDRLGKKLIYICTDAVFDGKKKGAYIETDKVFPLNVYAKTKLLGEDSVLKTSRGLVLRVNIIGWRADEKKSFFEWLLEGLKEKKNLNLFDDVFFSPLNVADLAKIISQIIDKELIGIYHCGSRDFCSKYQFGIRVAEIFGLPSNKVTQVSLKDVSLRAHRPKNLVLNSTKLVKVLGHQLPSVDEAINLMKKQYELNDY